MTSTKDRGHHLPIDESIRRMSLGQMSRRVFVGNAVAAGLTLGMAGSLASIYSSRAYAASSKDIESIDGGYDYIVIGSGSSGGTLAYRLATKTDARILVLEAGSVDDIPELHDPRLWAAALATKATKSFDTVAQPHTAGRTHSWPRGNVLGGTSCLNAMIFARGHRSDYDGWAAAGCTGWDYASVLKHFKELETFEGGASDLRGASGPLYISQPKKDKAHPGAAAFIEAAVDLGYPETKDFNGPTMEGPAWVNFNIKDQQRQSTAVAFLKPAMERKNLTVLTDAPVTQLVFEGTRCVGVEYLHNGKPRTIRAEREVIVSAGAVDTPRILMLSGIGNASDLGKLGIKSIVDLKGVGENLQDHVLGAGPNYESPTPLPASNYNHSEVYMWWKSEAKLAAPDMITLYVSIPFSTPALPMKDVKNGWCMLSGVARPTSRGRLKLASAKYGDAPIIDPNYLATEHDRKVFSKATEIAREIALHKAYGSQRSREVLPGKDIKVGSPEWNEFLAKSVNTYFHPTSTCRMGADEMAVVDPQLKVRGVSGLRIADASIMPSITTSNTNAPSIMIGWKCAEMISATSRT